MLKIRSAVVPSWRSSPLTSAQGEVMRIRDRLFADDPRADRRQGVAAFHPQVRAVVVFQIVADRVVIAHGIAGDIIHSLGFADAARGFPNHHHQFGFVVHVFDVIRAYRLLLVASKGVRRFDEYQRLGWRFKFQLAGVVGVIQPQREQRAVGGRQPAEFTFF